MRRRFAAMLLVCGPLMTTACTTQQPTTLEGMRDLERRKLALQCYSEKEGERIVFGAHRTFMACSQWAHRVMKVRYPQTPSVLNTYR